jgi:hypothetical protein
MVIFVLKLAILVTATTVSASFLISLKQLCFVDVCSHTLEYSRQRVLFQSVGQTTPAQWLIFFFFFLAFRDKRDPDS